MYKPSQLNLILTGELKVAETANIGWVTHANQLEGNHKPTNHSHKALRTLTDADLLYL